MRSGRLVQGWDDGVLRIWRLGASRPLELAGHAAPIVAVLVPHNRLAATAALDGTVRLWDLPTSEQCGRSRWESAPAH